MNSQIFFQLFSLFAVVTAGPLVILLLVFNNRKL
uniref:Photosystem II protein psb30 n=1 Tax=Pseudocodium devriesii TaxID=453070 RepID=A0A386B156_9CHLO|nr:photosystem II protein psb30 [Pseudocodium devriesii]AYC65431.1 photosystem II protein psb30 [Pseudocodium devriesii]